MLPTAFRTPSALAAFLFPSLVVFEKNFASVYLIVLLIGAAVLARPYAVRFWKPLVAVIGALTLLCLLSALWSIDPAHSAIRFIRLGLAVVGGVALCALAAARDAEGRRATTTAFAAGLAVAGAIAILSPFAAAALPEGPVAAYLHWIPGLSFGALATLMIFALAAALAERPILPVVPVAIVVAAAAVLMGGNTTSKIALIVGAAVAAILSLLGRKALVALAVLMPLLFLALPVAVHEADTSGFLKAHGWTLNHSATHRLIIGRYTMGKIEERPILGWGLHSSRILPDREGPVFGNPRYEDLLGLTDFAPGTRIELMPMHPHNATLQTWLELGVLGPLLYAALYPLVLLALGRVARSRLACAAGGGGVAAAFVIGQVSFNVWQSWWLTAQFLAVMFFLYVLPKAGTACAEGTADP